MEQRVLGSTGVAIPVVGQGTWQMELDDEAACIDAIRRGIDAGMTHIDTAEMYGSGRAEEIVGQAIRGRRDAVFLVSKVLPDNASRVRMPRSCEASLERLGTDRLDCYLLHWPGRHPLEDTVEAFEALKRGGKIRTWGVSNLDETELERLLATVGPGRIACNQVLYHLAERAIEHAVLPYCREHGIAVVGYSPFGGRGGGLESERGFPVLEQIGRAHEATARQVALAFLVREAPLFTIPKSAREQHVLENARAGDLELSADEIERIDRAFPRGPRRSGVPVL